MDPIEGVDYAWARPSIPGLVAVGKHFACRYVGRGSAGKLLTVDEAADLSSHGLSIVANVEGLESELLGGAPVGTTWALAAHTHAVACGMPPDKPIYLSVDFNVGPSQWPAVAAALRAAGGVLGADRVGVYGGYNAIAWAIRDHVAHWYWQTAAWSGGRWHPMAHIRQYRNGVSLVGGDVDLDRAMVADYGQWTVGSQPTPEEEHMALSDQSAHNMIWITDKGWRGENPIKIPANGDGNWAGEIPNGIVERLDRIETAVKGLDDAVDLAALRTLVADVRDVLVEVKDTPLIDAVAVAAAIGGLPELVDALAGRVAERLARIQLSVSLTGSASGGIVPPAA